MGVQVSNRIFSVPRACLNSAANTDLTDSFWLGAGSSIWYATVVRADGGSIRVGPETSVQDNSILHTAPGSGAITVGRGVNAVGYPSVEAMISGVFGILLAGLRKAGIEEQNRPAVSRLSRRNRSY